MPIGRAKLLRPAPAPRARRFASNWRGFAATLDPAGPEDEALARRAAEMFTAYLRAARGDVYALSTLPPGRFLMPGDLEGSPALTFAPLHCRRVLTCREGNAGGDDGAALRIL